MEKLTGCNPSISVSRVLSQFNYPWKARVKIDINFFCVKWYSEFKSFLCIPTDKVLLVVLFCALVVYDRVSMATNFAKQVKNFVCNVFTVHFLVL